MSEILINNPDPENSGRREWEKYRVKDGKLFEDIARYLAREGVYRPGKKWQPLGVGLALSLSAGLATSYLISNAVESLAVAAGTLAGTTGFLIAYRGAQLLAEIRDIRRENALREYPQSYDLDF